MRGSLVVCVLVVGCVALWTGYAEGCNEGLCASLVSKCMLLKSCECDMRDKRNCTCCTQCHRCLDRLYTECCDCVGLCPSRVGSPVIGASSVEELKDPIPELFDVLTADEDPQQRWHVITYPAVHDILSFKPRGVSLEDLGLENLGKGEHRIRHGKSHLEQHLTTTNCTVAYMAPCMSLRKCTDSCRSMGAARYRWFNQFGCCECIGDTCPGFGKGEALCTKCPLPEDEEEEGDDYYYSSNQDIHGEDEEDEDEDDEEDDDNYLDEDEDDAERDLLQVDETGVVDEMLKVEDQGLVGVEEVKAGGY